MDHLQQACLMTMDLSRYATYPVECPRCLEFFEVGATGGRNGGSCVPEATRQTRGAALILEACHPDVQHSRPKDRIQDFSALLKGWRQSSH